MKKNIALIIEDDLNLSTIFAGALKAAEYETEIIQDGQIALERLETLVPTLVLLDMHLPNLSGDDILRWIRSQERLAHTRIMLATADALMADSLRDEADLVLLKPISFNQLRDLAARLRPPDTSDLD